MTNDERRLLDYLARWRVDPIAFARECFGVEPTAQQAQLLTEAARPGAHVAAKAGHGVGKTSALAWEIIRTVMCFSDCRVPCTAPTGHQLRDLLWAEIHKWHQRMPDLLREQVIVQTDRVSIRGAEQSQFAVARTARRETPDALQGFHASNLLFVIDEAPGVPEEIFDVARGALSTAGARVLMAGNPTRLTGFFHRAFHKNRDLWSRLTFSSRDSPLVAPAYCEDMAREYGEDSDIYRVRVLGEFPRAAEVQLISLDLVEAAMGRHLRPDQYSFAPIVLGVDPAWYGDDRSVVFLRQGLRSQLLGVWRQIDNMTLAGLVAQFWQQHSANACFVDMGWGAGVIDRLRQLRFDPIPVAFQSPALDRRYANRRAEMWCAMRDWLAEGGALPNVPDLRDDLIGPEYSFNAAGRIVLERKEDMKKRGLASPDLADALALTFSGPVQKRALPLPGQNRGVFAQHKYDVLDLGGQIEHGRG